MVESAAMKRRLLTVLALTAGLLAQTAPQPTIVFVCEHGAAKSVIAAAYFNKLAEERHLPFHAVARGTTPQAELSQSAVAGLRKDGVSFPADKPQALTADDVQKAARVVAFCPVPASLAKGKRVSTYDVPAPSDGYDASRDAILQQVRLLIDQLQRTSAASPK
jgi:arsenate reductase